jgi:hypothetical protein
MKDGMIVEDGSHDELIRLKGTYYDLWGKQILDLAAVPSKSRSKSPHKNRAIISPDLEQESNKAELPKIVEETAEDLQRGDHPVLEECQSAKVGVFSINN